MKKYTHAGFTLIELLVVVAIIGLLASIVFASLGTARGRGADAAIKGNLSNARGQAELFADGNSNSYSGVCAGAVHSFLLKAASATGAAVNEAAGTTGAPATATCHDSAGAWGAEAPLRTAGFWCVDSSGFSSSTAATSLAASDYACN